MSMVIVWVFGIWLGIVNFVFIFVGLYLIDCMGCCLLMYIGLVGYIVFFLLVFYVFFMGVMGIWVVVMICGFIVVYVVG